jgi:uncharacterized membrane protein
MLYNLIVRSSTGDAILKWIEAAAWAVEILVAVFIIAAIFYAIGRYLVSAKLRTAPHDRYEQLKHRLGRSLLLSLEILIAADIVHTVALEMTLQSIMTLGLLVLIRTFLSWTLMVEIEGRWPWQVKAGAPRARD